MAATADKILVKFKPNTSESIPLLQEQVSLRAYCARSSPAQAWATPPEDVGWHWEPCPGLVPGNILVPRRPPDRVNEWTRSWPRSHTRECPRTSPVLPYWAEAPPREEQEDPDFLVMVPTTPAPRAGFGGPFPHTSAHTLAAHHRNRAQSPRFPLCCELLSSPGTSHSPAISNTEGITIFLTHLPCPLVEEQTRNLPLWSHV